MGVFRQFPYSNFHEMNMDEIIKIVKQLADDWVEYQLKWKNLYTDTAQALADFKEYANNYFANLNVQNEINNKLESMLNNGEFDSVIETTLSPVVTNWLEENIQITEGVVIDSSLSIAGACADAKATGDADAEIISNLETLSTEGVANYHFKGSNNTLNGITYSWNRYTCSVTGSASSASVNALIARTTLPDWIIAGKQYFVDIISNNPLVKLGFVFFNSGGTPTYKYLTESELLTIPWDCVEWSVRLYIEPATVITGTAQITASIRYNPQIKIDAEFAREMSETSDNLFSANVPDNIPASTVNISGIKNNNNSYHVTANLTNQTGILNCYYNKKRLPEGIKPGCTYEIGFTPTKFRIVVISYISENDSGTVLWEKAQDNEVIQNGNFTVPINATGFAIRMIYVASGTVSIIEDISVAIVTIPFYENNTAKLCCIGNSFTTGAVWVNGVFNHIASFYNTIYAQIGLSLNLNRFNIRNFMYSSTGMLYDAGAGNFHSLIKNNLNINNYEYVLTLFSSGDISSYPLGNINSTANDGTLAGAVIDLCEHFKQTNDKCRLIVLSVPPYSSDAPHTGNSVFTGNWSQGYSIDDLDKLMFKLAKKYHFIFISWQDLSMSYHYMDFADYTTGDTGPRHANDDSVYYALGRYAGMQIKAVNSPIAMSYICD